MGKNYYGYPRYVSVAEKRAKAEKKLKQLMKKNPGLAPVIPRGNSLAESWWGKAWNKNLEDYADYSNRIGRGRSYVKHGAVLDLKIEPGTITSLVQGSAARPYQVEISIKPVKKSVWDTIIEDCRGAIDSLEALLDGTLPKAMETVLTRRGNGIFPSPQEIRFDCSCPDWASMCKHVAATLYGVGARLDSDPSLFFLLRKVNMDDLVSSVVRTEADGLLKKAGSRKSARIIRDADLSSEFGIEFEDDALLVSPLSSMSGKRSPEITAPGKKDPGKKDPGKKDPGRAISQKKPGGGNASPEAEPVRKAALSPAAADVTPYETVVRIICRRRVNGIGFQEIKEKSGLEETLLRNIIQRARQKKDIRNNGRGLYIKG
ncbi:MAG: hypothetical protein V1793_08480 [Pseudomonadota bacterium]